MRMPSSPRSIAGVLRPGAFGLPYYCTPPVSVGANKMCRGKNYKKIDIQKTVAAVWRQNNKTIEKMALTVCGVLHDYSGAVRV